MNIVLSEQAQEELADAVEYYNAQKENLGYEFKILVDESINLIERSPLLYPVIDDEIRRKVLSRFSYSIFFFIDEIENIILIISITHQHRKPFYKI